MEKINFAQMEIDAVAIADLRQDYRYQELLESDVDPDPFRQFQRWFDQAVAADLPEPNAMTLATVTTDGRPAARMVLLKGFSPEGFVLYTNYQSRKGQELAQTPFAALVFWWAELERQVRIEGAISKVPNAQTEAYFDSRPRGSQIGAWASEQSEVISDRVTLEKRLHDLEQQHEGRPIPRPPHWGGYCLTPNLIEFWQGRPNRLHDRLCYRLANQQWQVERLSP
jgi:pyridoxamine 5'-phosphate oxidase